jgi:predicted PurR-regulated permease PerM
LSAERPWTATTRDRWFYAFLAATTVALAWLFSPWADVLLFAGTTVVVTWPAYAWVLRRVGGNRAAAAVVTTLSLALLVFGPVSLLLYLFAVEAVVVGQQGIDLVTSGAVEAWAQRVVYSLPTAEFETYIGEYLPEEFDPVGAVVGPIREGILAVLNGLGGAVPVVVNLIVSGSIDFVIFVLAVVTFYMEGPTVLRAAARLSPMDDRYEERLFFVFREFANNLVIGSIATAAVQGGVAALGYAIAGVDRVLFASILTGVFSFFPLVGTAVVWVPIALYVGATHGAGWAAFVVMWSLVFTGTVDNVLKPLFLRGSSNIHPLLIFLAVFGGLTWLGLPGVLVGPVLVACFLALYTIYCEDFLGIPPEVEVPRPSGSWIQRLRGMGSNPAPPSATSAEGGEG